MCDIKEALGRIFTPAGTGGLEAQQQAAADAALKAQQQAKQAADIAAAGPASSENAAQATEARLRLLLASTGSNASFAGGGVMTPTPATKMLTGS